MIQETELAHLLFFDLETSSEYATFAELKEKNPRRAQLWKEKHEKMKEREDWKKFNNKLIDLSTDSSVDESYRAMAPLFPEFGRIVCGSFCHFITGSNNGKMVLVGRMKSFFDTAPSEFSEIENVLKPISDMLHNIDKSGRNMKLCGHNIKNFDIPWLAKRMIVNGVIVPAQLQTWGKKPWDIHHVDTAELWAMGGWGNYISLDTLSCSLNVPSPKGTMKGEYVGETFWKEKNYNKIKKYCEEDVKCVGRICHALSGSILPTTFETAPEKITAAQLA